MDAINLSHYILHKCTNENNPISNLQLQKILYYIQKESLTRNNEPFFSDEIEAWQFGPVVPSVYYYYCGSGSNPIKIFTKPDVIIKDSMVDAIVEEKRNLPPWTLVDDTHKEGRAWDLTYRNGFGNRNIIDKELIKING